MLQQLYGVVQKPGAREGDAHMATDNAVSAVGKLVEFQRPHVDAPALLGAWLGYLPMREDTDEACQVRVSGEPFEPICLAPGRGVTWPSRRDCWRAARPRRSRLCS